MKGLGLKQRNGFWYVWKRLNGRYIRETTGVEVGQGARAKELKAAAERRATEILKQAFETDHNWKLAPLFKDWWTEYLNGAGQQNTWTGEPCTELTMLWKRRATDAIVSSFGKMRIDAITQADCLAFLTKLSKMGYAPGSVRNYAIHAKTAMSAAHRAQKILFNPWAGVVLPKRGRKTRVLSRDDVQKIWDEFERRFNDDEMYTAESVESLRNFIVVALGTGLRIGALLRLGPAHIKGTASGDIIEIMSKGKLHRVPILPAVRYALGRQLAISTSNRVIPGRLVDPARRAGRYFYWTEPGVRGALWRLADAAKIERFSPHDMRRTFITRLAVGDGLTTAAVPMPLTSALANHCDVQTTAKFYTVADTDDLKSKALNGASALLGLPESGLVTKAVTP